MSGIYFLKFLKVIFLLSPFEELHHSLFYPSILFLTFFSSTNGFSKSTQIPNFMKIRIVRVKLFDADIRTDRHDEDDCRCSQFCESA